MIQAIEKLIEDVPDWVLYILIIPVALALFALWAVVMFWIASFAFTFGWPGLVVFFLWFLGSRSS
jgi:hypothetical protein